MFGLVFELGVTNRQDKLNFECSENLPPNARLIVSHKIQVACKGNLKLVNCTFFLN